MTVDPFTPVTEQAVTGEARGNLDALARLFPDAMVDGELDLDVLRDLIGQQAERSSTEGFGLRWPGMSQARRLAALPATETLLPRPDESVDWDTTRNVVIEGDNLEVLRLLRRGYTGAVDVIYIDPPYNTTNDFVYDDNFSATRAETETVAGLRDEEGTLENGVASNLAADRRAGASRHSKWLSMMYPRLLTAFHLLKETGLTFVSINEIEHSRLRLLLDRIFGAENFVCDLIWKSKSGGASDTGHIAIDHEYVLVYAKNSGTTSTYPDREATVSTSYNRQDELGRYSLERLDKQNLNYSSAMDYELVGPDGRVYMLEHRDPARPNATWRWSKQKVRAELDKLIFEAGNVYTKNYEKDGVKPRSLLVEERFGRTRTGSSEVQRLLGAALFDNPKPVKLLRHIMAISCPAGGLALDFFAGSGSTGHAVMDLNSTDSGNRRYMLVQLDELVNEDGYATIADITRERLRRAGAQIAAQRTLDAQDIDTGFRSYRLATSNVKPWDGTGELNLLEAVENLVEGRTTDDLLVEMMLRLGIDLVTPVKQREVAGSLLYSLAGTLYAFFGVDLDTTRAEQVARAVVGWRDEDPVDSEVTVVVRDTGFRDSEAKLNLAAALQQAGITTLRSI